MLFNSACRFLLILTVLNFGVRSIRADEPPKVDFSHDIVPILRKHCVECHGGAKSEGGFSLNTRRLLLESESVAAGAAAQSRLIELVESKDDSEQMPPKDRNRLSTSEVAALRKWIDTGAEWQDGFSFAGKTYEPPLAPRRPKLPPIVDGRSNSIDRILDAQLARSEREPTAPLTDPQFLRRVTLDLIGALPSEDELAEFVSDTSARKRARAVERLLNDNRAYTEHWMTFWNDLLRNAYAGTGYIDGGRKQITGWLYGSLLENKPYDQFVKELIAPTPESEGFIKGIKWRGNVNASQVREIQFSQNVSQVFLGINMKCASCHDSFIDRWTLDEAYGLAAVYSTRELEIHRCDKPTGRIPKGAWIFPSLGTIDPNAKQPERLRQLAGLVTHRDNGRFARTIVNRIWHRLMGRGIVHPVDAMHTRPWNEDLLDQLAVEFVDSGYDLKSLMTLIVTSKAYQSRAVVLESTAETKQFEYGGPIAHRMTAEQYLDAIRQVTRLHASPDNKAFKKDGRGQGGQLAAVMSFHGGGSKWDDHPLRSALMPRDPLQASLGRPNREQVVTTRPALLTTLEAINLSNGPELAVLLNNGGQQILKEFERDSDSMVRSVYLRSLSREPTVAETEIALEILGTTPTTETVADFLWVVFMLPEFQMIR